MRTRRIGAVAAVAALALGLTACGSDDGGGSGGSGGGGLKIGIKFDQPGLGLKQGSEFTGMDVDVAKYIAKQLGTDEGDIQFPETREYVDGVMNHRAAYRKHYDDELGY